MNEELNRSTMESALQMLVQNQELLEASMKPMAELLHAKLAALVAAGFRRDEALSIIMARGLNP